GLTHPGLGTVVGPDDARLLRRLLTRLAAEAPTTPRLLVVDDLGTVLRCLDDRTREGSVALLDRLVRGHGPALAVAGPPGDLLRLVPHATDLLALGRLDPA